jgi:hypothetical protein
MATGMSVRRIAGYAASSVPIQVSLRNLYIYSLYTEPKVILRNKTNKLLLLDLINKETTEAFTLSRISIDLPKVNSIAFEKNTTVVVNALLLSGYRDSVTLKYNRYTIDQYFPDVTWKLNVTVATTLHTLIPAINAAYGCNLVTDDVVDQPVKANASTIEITAAATSYMFLPGTKVRLGVFLGIPLVEAVTTTDLLGFDAVIA